MQGHIKLYLDHIIIAHIDLWCFHGKIIIRETGIVLEHSCRGCVPQIRILPTSAYSPILSGKRFPRVRIYR